MGFIKSIAMSLDRRIDNRKSVLQQNFLSKIKSESAKGKPKDSKLTLKTISIYLKSDEYLSTLHRIKYQLEDAAKEGEKMKK